MSILVGHYSHTDGGPGFKDILVDKQKINFLPAGDQNDRVNFDNSDRDLINRDRNQVRPILS